MKKSLVSKMKNELRGNENEEKVVQNEGHKMHSVDFSDHSSSL